MRVFCTCIVVRLPTNFRFLVLWANFCLVFGLASLAMGKNGHIQLDIKHSIQQNDHLHSPILLIFEWMEILNVYRKWKSHQIQSETICFFLSSLAEKKPNNPSKQIVMAATKYKKKYTNISGSQWNVFLCFCCCCRCCVTKTLERAKRNSEWFFSWSLAWNGNGFVRKLQLKKNLMGCVCECGGAYYKISTSTMSIKNVCTAHSHINVYSIFELNTMANAATRVCWATTTTTKIEIQTTKMMTIASSFVFTQSKRTTYMWWHEDSSKL